MIKWKKTDLRAPTQRRNRGFFMVGQAPFGLAGGPSASLTDVQDLEGRVVATNVPQFPVRVSAKHVLFGGGNGPGQLWRADSEPWVKIADTPAGVLGFGGGRLVVSEVHSRGPDGRSTVHVLQFNSEGLQAEESWADQPLYSAGAVSEQHLLLYRRDRLLAFELVEGRWLPRTIDFPGSGRGSTAGIAIQGDIACLTAPLDSGEQDVIELFLFHEGTWEHTSNSQKKFQSSFGRVVTVGDTFFVVGAARAFAYRVNGGEIHTKKLSLKGEFAAGEASFCVGVPGGLQLYAMSAGSARTNDTREAKKDGHRAVAPLLGTAPVPEPWTERIGALLGLCDTRGAEELSDAFRAFLAELEAQCLQDPSTTEWLGTLDQRLSSIPSAVRVANHKTRPSSPIFPLVRVAHASPSNAVEFRHLRTSHLRCLRATIPAKSAAELFLKGSDYWAGLKTLIFQNPDPGRTAVSDSGLRAMARVSFPELEYLSLRRSGVTVKGLVALAERGSTPKLREVNLSSLGMFKKNHPGLDADGLRFFGSSAPVQAVNVEGSADSAAVVALLETTRATLKQLHTSCSLSVENLAVAERLESLRVSRLENVEAGEPLPSLRRLSLWGWQLTSSDVEHLARLFPGLEHLHLTSAAGPVADLSPLLPQLRTLHLGGSAGEEYDAWVRALVANSEVASLDVLRLRWHQHDIATNHQRLEHVRIHPCAERTWSGAKTTPLYTLKRTEFVNSSDEPFADV